MTTKSFEIQNLLVYDHHHSPDAKSSSPVTRFLRLSSISCTYMYIQKTHSHKQSNFDIGVADHWWWSRKARLVSSHHASWLLIDVWSTAHHSISIYTWLVYIEIPLFASRNTLKNNYFLFIALSSRASANTSLLRRCCVYRKTAHHHQTSSTSESIQTENGWCEAHGRDGWLDLRTVVRPWYVRSVVSGVADVWTTIQV